MYLVCLIEYFGAHTIGWQSQPSLEPSIQQYCAQAIQKFTGQAPQKIDCAGRTDKGVHALGQVIGFHTEIIRESKKWITGLNHYLPLFIRCIEVKPYPSDTQFHPRFSAYSRTYRYYLFHNQRAQSCLQGLVVPFFKPLNGDLLHQTAKMIEGVHDFKAFQGGSCQAKTTVKRCFQAHWTLYEDYSIFHIQAKSFLHHMVRYIVGCQLQVALQTHSLEWFHDLFLLKGFQDYCAPPQGLYLTHVQYDGKYEIPWKEGRVWFDPSAHTPNS